MYQDLAILALFILVYSAVAGRVERTWVYCGEINTYNLLTTFLIIYVKG